MNKTLMVCLVCVLAGCKFVAPHPGPILADYGRFETSEYQRVELDKQELERITARFDGLDFAGSMRLLSDLSGCAVVWDEGLDNKVVSGYYRDIPLVTVLDSLGRRVGAEVNDIGGVYYVGQLKADDLASAVISMPPGAVGPVKESLQAIVSQRGRVAVVSGVIMLRDTVESVRKVLSVVEQWRQAVTRRYYAEIWFVAMRESDWVRLGIEAQLRAVDLLQVANAEKLFSLIAQGELDLEKSAVVQAPVIQVAEGIEGRLRMGREVPIEEKAVTDSGTIETTGYELLADGIEIGVSVHRVSSEMVSVQFSADVSDFEEIKEGQRPIRATRQVKSTLIMRPGEVTLVGGVGRESRGRGVTLVVGEAGYEKETVLVWLRVREISSVSRIGPLARITKGTDNVGKK